MKNPLNFSSDFRKNIAERLREHAEFSPERIGLIFPSRKSEKSNTVYSQKTFRELDLQSDAYAYGLLKIGICQGTKTILMVKPGVQLYTLVFALFKIGAIPVVVDPGMGMKRMLHCYKTAGAEAFIGIPAAHIIRILNSRIFSSLKAIVNVGSQCFLGAHRLGDLVKQQHIEKFSLSTVAPDDLMIINFTTGSTGPAKGVEYTYQMADAILNQISHLYRQNTNTISLATLPLFGIFDLLIGSTSVLPAMDPTKPAKANPEKMLEAIYKFKVSHMFASPAFLHRIAEYVGSSVKAVNNEAKLSSLRYVISGGAPVSRSVVEAIHAILPPSAFFHITYGSTEALPISSILSSEWLAEVKSMSASGKGTCVGLPVRGLSVRIIQISDTPFLTFSNSLVLPAGEIGEIILSGSIVSQRYYGNRYQNELMKIVSSQKPADLHVWHRTGDLGWLDEQGRIWFCGRKSDRVLTADNILYTEQLEGIFNSHPAVYRSALIGIGQHGMQIPMICIELKEKQSAQTKKQIASELLVIAKQNKLTQNIEKILFHRSFPVDIRHNAKVDRKKLAHWAQYKINTRFSLMSLSRGARSDVYISAERVHERRATMDQVYQREPKTNLKWLMLIPLAGWFFLLFGIFYPINSIPLKVIWWIDVFLSIFVHGLQLFISLPLAKRAAISTKKTIFLTFLFGASWWGFLNSKKSASYRRKISPFERLCVATQNVFPPLANQFVIEGTGAIDKQNLQTAIARAAQFCPGTRLVLEGKDWIDSGNIPALHEIILENFDGYNFEEIPRLWESLDVTQGFACEVLLISSKEKSAKTTLIFRSSHGVMDGRGTLYWAEEVFRALRGENLLGAKSEINEIELLTKLVKPVRRRELNFNAQSPLSSEPLKNSYFFWKRRTIAGQHPAMVAKLAAAILNFTKQNKLLFMVPVDLRRHEKTIQSTACLSLPIFLSAQKGETWEGLREGLLQRLAEKKELALDGSEWTLSHFPLIIISFFMRLFLLAQSFRKKYMASAILSNIGKIKLHTFTVTDFIPQSVYALPVHNAMIPLFFVTTQCPEHIELMVSCSAGSAIEQEVDELLNQITSSIT